MRQPTPEEVEAILRSAEGPENRMMRSSSKSTICSSSGHEWQNMQQQMQMQMQQFIPEEEERAVAASGPGAFKRTGASPLQVSAGMDVAVIRKKISELAMAIIGDGEDVEVDTPLLEAGLTSNTAVVLRDELSKDLPGIKLPPTLIFDYPSISSMADYVVEQAR
mmetsp:Transcript_81795/g.215770  ORF Transcript_81795/g.215770 Transcript_81795/m.215770 type:complete len:164 (-) Transcript_81795:76-567(-)